jgi:hypothetical protein
MFRWIEGLALVVTCSDWRLHHRRTNFDRSIARLLRARGVDVIALPGPDGLLSPERAGEWQIMLKQALLLIEVHRIQSVALVAHQRCAGHPVTDAEHEQDVVTTATALKEALAFKGPVSAVIAIYKTDSRWNLKRVALI